MGKSEDGISVDINDVVGNLLQVISGQVLQIAKLEALKKKLMMELQEKEARG